MPRLLAINERARVHFARGTVASHRFEPARVAFQRLDQARCVLGISRLGNSQGELLLAHNAVVVTERQAGFDQRLHHVELLGVEQPIHLAADIDCPLQHLCRRLVVAIFRVDRGDTGQCRDELIRVRDWLRFDDGRSPEVVLLRPVVVAQSSLRRRQLEERIDELQRRWPVLFFGQGNRLLGSQQRLRIGLWRRASAARWKARRAAIPARHTAAAASSACVTARTVTNMLRSIARLARALAFAPPCELSIPMRSDEAVTDRSVRSLPGEGQRKLTLMSHDPTEAVGTRGMPMVE